MMPSKMLLKKEDKRIGIDVHFDFIREVVY